jgi:tetratricopeptide (TPR) repeat protein
MALFDSLFGRSSSSKTRVGTIERYSEKAFMPSATAVTAAAVVLVAEFGGARGREVTIRLSDLLVRESGVEVYRRNQVLKLSGQGSLAERLAAAATQGQAWMTEAKADLLIWGEADESGATLSIRFLPALADAEGTVGVFGLGDCLQLPFPFASELEPLIVAAVLAAARGPSGSRTRAAEMLRGMQASLEHLFASLPQGLSEEQAASILIALGHVRATDFRLDHQTGRLEQALAAYEKAANALTRERSPVMWVLAQNHRAATLQALAEHTKSAKPLHTAADAYRAIAATLDKTGHAVDWALAHVRLGMVLYKLGAEEGRASFYKESRTAFENALTVITRATMPARWAELMNHYGVLLTALGEHLTGTAALEQAVGAFNKALEVRRRDRFPLLWAQTMNNLGAAAFALAKRTGNRTMLSDAAACFQGATDVYQENDQTARAHVIEKNLQRVKRLLTGQALAETPPTGKEKGRRT